MNPATLRSVAFLLGTVATVLGAGLYDYRIGLLTGGIILAALSIAGERHANTTKPDGH